MSQLPSLGPRLVGVTDILAARARGLAHGRAALVAISGIDASGKGTVAAEIVRGLELRGLRTAFVPLDPWHEEASVRLGAVEPAVHFYQQAFRWGDLFGRLVDPLVRDRSIRITARQLRLRDDTWYEHAYAFDDVDVVLVEGIFLFKRELRERYDASLWIECSFETALARALTRNQEGLPRDRLISDYEHLYFPAQRIHFLRDAPRSFAELTFSNE